MNRKREITIAIASAAMLRALLIWQAPLWYDENFTYLLSGLPFRQMLAATAGDVHPPLSYIVFWAVAHLGGAPWTLRIPAALFSLGSVWLFWQLLQHWTIRTPVRRAALALMVAAPFQLWYAQEARMYAMLEFAFLLGALAVCRRRWGLLLISGLALVYLQNYGVFYVATLWAFAMLRAWRKSDFVAPTLTSALIALGWLPWAQTLLRQARGIEGAYWIMRVALGATLDMIVKMFWGYSITANATALFFMLTIAAVIVGVSAAIRARRQDWLLLAFGPLALAIIASLVWQPVLILRPLIGSTPFVYLIVAAGLETPHARQQTKLRARLLAAIIVAPLVIIGVGGYYVRTASIKQASTEPNMSSALAYIRANWQEGDILYHTDDGSYINWAPYSPELTHVKMPDCAPVRGALSTATRAALGMDIRALDSVPHQRAWIAAPLTPLHPTCYEQALDELLRDADLVFQIDDNELITSGVWVK